MDDKSLAERITDVHCFNPPRSKARWHLRLDGALVTGLTTTQLLSFTAFRNRVVECCPVLLPSMMNREWHAILVPLMTRVTRHNDSKETDNG